jgi:hypothetical protein
LYIAEGGRCTYMTPSVPDCSVDALAATIMSDYMIGELTWKGSLNEERVSLRKGGWRGQIRCASASFQYLHRGVVTVTTVSDRDEVGIMSKVTRLRSCQNDVGGTRKSSEEFGSLGQSASGSAGHLLLTKPRVWVYHST